MKNINKNKFRIINLALVGGFFILFFGLATSAQAVGFGVGNSSLILGSGENLFYGNVSGSSNAASNFLLFQKDATTNLFKIGPDGSAYFAGNVGIGTTSPGQLLTVGNNNQFTVSSSGNVTELTTNVIGKLIVASPVTVTCPGGTSPNGNPAGIYYYGGQYAGFNYYKMGAWYLYTDEGSYWHFGSVMNTSLPEGSYWYINGGSLQGGPNLVPASGSEWGARNGASGTLTTTNQLIANVVAGNANIAGFLSVGRTANPRSLLQISSPGAMFSLSNANNGTGLGGFWGDAYYTNQFGLYNDTSSAWGGVPAHTQRAMFGFNYNGKVGSISSDFGGDPAWRNVLDDGTGNMTINGNVGIGNASPTTAKLVFGNLGTNAIDAGSARITGLATGVASTDAVNYNQVQSMISTATSSISSYWTLSGSNLFPATSYNIGIGTTGTGAKLDVNYSPGSSGSDVGLLLRGDTNYQANLAIQGSTGANPYRLLLSSLPTGGAYLQNYSSGANTYNTFNFLGSQLNFETTASTYAARVQALTILNSGNVGIGAVTPTTAKLVLGNLGTNAIDAGSARITGLATGVASTDAVNYNQVQSMISTATSSISNYWSLNGANIYNSTGTNVGIGTTTPGYKLDVQGGQANASGGLCIAGDCKTAWSQVSGTSYWTLSGSNLYSSSTTYNVGIGTINPSVGKLESWSDSYPLVLRNAAGTKGMTFGYVSSTNTFKIFSDYYDAGPEPNFVFGTYSNQNNQMVFATSGNVGIGTIAPTTAKLVLGNLGTNAIDAGSARITGLATGVVSTDAVNYNQVQSMISTATSSISNYWSLNGANIYNSTGTNVGIGTTDPTNFLDIVKTQNAATLLSLTNAGTGANSRSYLNIGSDSSSLNIGYGYSNSSFNIGAGYEMLAANTGWVYANSGVAGMTITAAKSDGYVRFATGGWAAANERMRIKSDGTVGIGATNPTTAKLVFGNLGTNAIDAGSARITGVATGVASTDAVNYNQVQSMISTATSSIGNYWSLNGANIYNSTGTNVGIGTTSPVVKLNVVGDLQGTGLIRSTGGAVGGTTGPGVEIQYITGGDYGSINAYDRTAMAYKPIRFDGSTVRFGVSAVDKMVIAATGVVTLTNELIVSGTGNSSIAGNLGIGATNPLSLLQIGVPTTVNSVYNTASRIRAIGSTAQSATDEIILRLNRGENISQFYPGTADFKLGSYGAGGAGDNYAPKTRLTLALKSTSNFNEGADVDVMTLLSSGYVGIGTTVPTSAKLVLGNAGTYSLDAGGYRVTNLATAVSASDATRLSDVQSQVAAGFLAAREATFDMGSYNIVNVGKLTVGTVDPLYDIFGTKYSTYGTSIAGGVKEEYVGQFNISKKVAQGYEGVIDFSTLKSDSDLWVWRQVVDFSPDNVQVFMTPSGSFAQTYYIIDNNKLIFRSDKPVSISYRLIGKRFDWKSWPTRATDQTEKASLIIK